MKALLIRVAVDQAYGGWNAPVDPVSHQFAYVPIPESSKTVFHPGCERRYELILPALNHFCQQHGKSLDTDLKFPPELHCRAIHLDPDFDQLTYGDNGGRRGAGIVGMQAGDLLVFYAGLRPIDPCIHRLIYAIIGLYVVDEVLPAASVPEDRWDENAHTRKSTRGADDVVVRARPGVSGRLRCCIPIGEWRDGSYRVRHDLLEAWGGLSVKDGFIQRSAVPPSFLDPEQFYKWWQSQSPQLIARNNPDAADASGDEAKVFLIQLRRPKRDASEARSDPFWEFGSFGCTGCHSNNLFHPRHANRLSGARLAFVQGGPKGSRLVFLSPPIRIEPWEDRCEARWTPALMPFKYEHAPILAWNERAGDFPLIERLAKSANCNTIEAGLSSRIRSRAKPLNADQAAEIVAVYNQHRAKAPQEGIAASYEQALSWTPPMVDRDRGASYQRRIRELAGELEPVARKKTCGSVQRRRHLKHKGKRGCHV